MQPRARLPRDAFTLCGASAVLVRADAPAPLLSHTRTTSPQPTPAQPLALTPNRPPPPSSTPVPLHPRHERSRHRTHLAQTSDTPVHSASSLPPTPPSRWLHTLAVRGSHGLPRRRAHTSRKRVAVPLARSRLHARLPKPDVAHVAAPREEHAAPAPHPRRCPATTLLLAEETG